MSQFGLPDSNDNVLEEGNNRPGRVLGDPLTDTDR